MNPISPTLNTHGFELKWDPEPFVATITEDGIVPHPSPEDPNSKIYLVAEISTTQFYRHASYLPGGQYKTFLDIFKWLNNTVIYLISEDSSDEIYCTCYHAIWKTLIIFGKLIRDNIVFERCASAFADIHK